MQVDVPPCVGWVGTGPLGISLQVGRFYAIGFDPNQAVTTFVDSESNDLPIDGQFGRLIGSETSTSVSLDTLDWGMPSSKSFTRQRLYTSPRAADDGGVDADASTRAARREPRRSVRRAGLGAGVIRTRRGSGDSATSRPPPSWLLHAQPLDGNAAD